ncbi:hypothetical protein niasHT_023386 [Heterodera trifolii]|uniref:Uncharacterized protein n=1 Tax=Heterodera trifolii TaxID=157864 RepID=A0ABD2K3W8_9BILA
MGVAFVLCCFSVAFTPSLFIFRRFVAPDPLRIILFVLGAFFWLCSLLLSAVVFAVFGQHLLLVAVFFSILFQEVARALFYLLLYKTQSNLAHLMAADANRTGTVSSMRLLYSSRHILAIVCGLGMGTAAALFHLANVLAAYWDDGVVGLPGAVQANRSMAEPTDASATAQPNAVPLPHHSDPAILLSAAADGGVTALAGNLHPSDAFFPLFYALGCALLTLFNIVWTVCSWDAFHRCCYKIGRPSAWVTTAVFTLCSHCANTGMSLYLGVSPLIVLSLQLFLLLLGVAYAYFLIKRT